jgi:DNA-binding MarR family transcriptional regulator
MVAVYIRPMSEKPSALQREIRQNKPFRSRSHEAVVGLLRTTDVVRRCLEKAMGSYGITLQQYNVLRILRGAGAEGLATLSIAERMIEATPGITRLLDRLEAKAMVRRERCPHDRRQVLCFLTPAGLDLVDRMDEPVHRGDYDAVAMLSEEDQESLIRLLDAIRAGHRCEPVAGADDTEAESEP